MRRWRPLAILYCTLLTLYGCAAAYLIYLTAHDWFVNRRVQEACRRAANDPNRSGEFHMDAMQIDGRTVYCLPISQEGRIDDGTRRHGPGNKLTLRNPDGTWPEPKN